MAEELTWEDFRKRLNITTEEEIEIQAEVEKIEAKIAKKRNNKKRIF